MAGSILSGSPFPALSTCSRGFPASHGRLAPSPCRPPRYRYRVRWNACSVYWPVANWHAASTRQQNPRKRTRSTARGRTQRAVAQDVSDDEYDEQYDDQDVRVATEKSYNLYIGDVPEVKKFYHRRLDELTMKPLRPIVTAWIKQREPKRLSNFGPYHKKLACDMPPECTPPWWPRDVPYEEPSHLDKAGMSAALLHVSKTNSRTGLLLLAVDMMLQHRLIDEVKRRGSWVQKLRITAEYAVQTTAPDQFSSSKGSGFSEKMQKRALSEILPNLFEVAQSYEDHFAQYQLYEGTGNEDPMTGTRVTWQHLTRPPRQTALRKRVRRTKAPAAQKLEPDADNSGDETEVDDTATVTHLRRGRRSQRQAQAPQNSHPQTVPQNSIPQVHVSQGLIPAPAHVTAPTTSQDDMRYRSAAPTPAPNTSFGQSMYGLQLGENMDLDVKVPYHDQALGQMTFPPSQPMQYSTSHSGFNPSAFRTHHDEGPFMGSAHSSFDHSFSFDPPYHPQVGDGSFTNLMNAGNAGFPYTYQDTYPPSSMPAPIGFFNGLPTSVSCQQEAYHL
jgi:hypothetical protein